MKSSTPTNVERKIDLRRFNPRCSHCGIYAGYGADNGTIYGCADPGAPEPYDPEYFCGKCSIDCKKREKEYFIKHGPGKITCYWWIKPYWYLEAVKEAGFVLVDDGAHNYELRHA